jgi:deoxyribose-phosphate aldolase
MVAAGATRIGASAGVKIIQAGQADAKPQPITAAVSKAY